MEEVAVIEAVLEELLGEVESRADVVESVGCVASCSPSATAPTLPILVPYPASDDDEVHSEHVIKIESDDSVIGKEDPEDFDDLDQNDHGDLIKVDSSSALPLASRLLFRETITLSDSEDDEDLPPFLVSDDDSDVEFERILAFTAKQRALDLQKASDEWLPKKRKKKNPANIEVEYANFPAIERLFVSVADDAPLEKVGVVKSIVDCLVVIESTPPPGQSSVALDYDCVLFKENRSCIGTVFDIFGPVRAPSYSVRFNSRDEAVAAVSIGSSVFFAANSDEFTKKVFTDQLRKERYTDSAVAVESEEEVLFSDDEAEKAYYASRQGRGGGGGGHRGGKRKRGGGAGPRDGSGGAGPREEGGGGGPPGGHRGRGGPWQGPQMAWPPASGRGRGRGRPQWRGGESRGRGGGGGWWSGRGQQGGNFRGGQRGGGHQYPNQQPPTHQQQQAPFPFVDTRNMYE